jgi:hypothetical protein
MKSKWMIQGLDNYRVGEDGNIYKLPFSSNFKYYETRLVKEQYPSRFRLNDEWYTKKRLRKLLVKDTNPIVLIDINDNLPF